MSFALLLIVVTFTVNSFELSALSPLLHSAFFSLTRSVGHIFTVIVKFVLVMCLSICLLILLLVLLLHVLAVKQICPCHLSPVKQSNNNNYNSNNNNNIISKKTQWGNIQLMNWWTSTIAKTWHFHSVPTALTGKLSLYVRMYVLSHSFNYVCIYVCPRLMHSPLRIPFKFYFLFFCSSVSSYHFHLLIASRSCMYVCMYVCVGFKSANNCKRHVVSAARS